MKRKLILATTLFTFLLVFTSAFAMNAYAATPPTHSSSSDFYSLEKACAVITVTLHGTLSPTTTCTQAKALSAATPLTEVRSCSASGITMEIDFNSYQNAVCFIATGYWAYRVNDVDEVFSPTDRNGWFLWYERGSTSGSFCNLNSGNGWDDAGFYYNPDYIDITQIYPGAQHNSPVSC